MSTIPNPIDLPPISEDRLSIYAEHKIKENDGKLIEKTIDESLERWKVERVDARFIAKREGKHIFLPYNLFCQLDSKSEVGMQIYIHCEDYELGSGHDMTYFKALEYTGLKTYALGVITFKDEVINGEKRSKEDREKAAFRLYNAFKKVKRSPHIIELCKVFSIHQAVEGVGFLTEYCKLGDLEKYLEKGHSLKDRDSRQILLNIASALIYLHDERKLAHYDVKTSNVLLTLNEEGKIIAKLGDLGFVAPIDKFEGNGTPSYFPPEFWAGYPARSAKDYEVYDGRAFDMWAFGDMMKKLIDGDHFIPDSTIDEIEVEFEENEWGAQLALKEVFATITYLTFDKSEAETLDKVCRHILQRDPKMRPGSMVEVKTKIEFIP